MRHPSRGRPRGLRASPPRAREARVSPGTPRDRPGDPIGACSDEEPSWGTPPGHRAGAPPSPGPLDGRLIADHSTGRRGRSGARLRLGPGPRRPRRDRSPPAPLPGRRAQLPPPRPRTAPSGPEARPRSWSRSGHAARPGTSDAFRSGPSRPRSEGARRRAPPGPPKRHHPPPAGPDRSVDRQRTRERAVTGGMPCSRARGHPPGAPLVPTPALPRTSPSPPGPDA